MFIEFMVAIVVFALGIIGVGVWGLKRNKSHVVIHDKNITLVTRNPQRKTFFIVVYFLALAGILSDGLIFYFHLVEEFEFFAYFILLLLALALSAHYLLNYYFDYCEVTEKKITDHSLTRRRDIVYNLEQITHANMQKSRVMLTNKENQAVASFHYDSLNGAVLINRLYSEFKTEIDDSLIAIYQVQLTVEDKEKREKAALEAAKAKTKKKDGKDEKSENVPEKVDEKTESKSTKNKKEKLVNDKYTEAQVEAYSLIGKQFRDDEVKNKRIDIIKIILFQIMLAAIVGVFIFISRNYLLIILFGVNIYVAFAKAKEFKIKYSFFNDSDFDLGLKFAYLNPNVKGYHRNKMKQTKTSAMLLSIIAIVVTAFNGYMTFTAKPIDYKDATTIEGTVTSVNKERFLELQLKDSEDKYSSYKFNISESFYPYISVDEVTSTPVDTYVKIKAVDIKDGRGQVLYLKLGDKEIINQATLDTHFDKYLTNQKIIFFSLLGVTIAILAGSFFYQFYLESQIKKETISLN